MNTKQKLAKVGKVRVFSSGYWKEVAQAIRDGKAIHYFGKLPPVDERQDDENIIIEAWLGEVNCIHAEVKIYLPCSEDTEYEFAAIYPESIDYVHEIDKACDSVASMMGMSEWNRKMELEEEKFIQDFVNNFWKSQ